MSRLGSGLRPRLRAAAALLALLGLAPGAYADGPGNCLGCHGSPGLSVTFLDGERVSGFVDRADLEASVHRALPCESCHRDVASGPHPGRKAGSRAELRRQAAGACGTCHSDQAARVQGSVHYRLSGTGPGGAGPSQRRDGPVCTDCHGFHTVGPRDSYRTLAGLPCRKCHEDIFTVYEQSVHGKSRAEGEHRAPLCSSCHFAHQVGSATGGTAMKAACLGCHPGTEEVHRAWLPNADLHLQSVACWACHAPQADKGVFLQIVDLETGLPVREEELSGLVGPEARDLAARVLERSGAVDSAEVSFLLKQANRQGGGRRIGLVGRMDVNEQSDAHQLAFTGGAVKECENCHHRDSPTYRNVHLALVREDGRRTSTKASPETLTSSDPVGGGRGFYVLGGTRGVWLDGLGAALAGLGLVVPLTHLWLRRRAAAGRSPREGGAAAPAGGAGQRVYVNSLPLRLWHWGNAVVFVLLLLTWLALRYQDLVSLARFRSAVVLHDILGVLMAVGFLLWLCGYACSGRLGLYLPRPHRRDYWQWMLAQAHYYGHGIFRGEPNPHHPSAETRFNPLQQIAYFFVMLVLFPVQIGTGALLMDVVRLAPVIDVLGGLGVVAGVHVAVSFALLAFLFVHVYLSTLGPTALGHIRAMVTGYEES